MHLPIDGKPPTSSTPQILPDSARGRNGRMLQEGPGLWVPAVFGHLAARAELHAAAGRVGGMRMQMRREGVGFLQPGNHQIMA